MQFNCLTETSPVQNSNVLTLVSPGQSIIFVFFCNIVFEFESWYVLSLFWTQFEIFPFVLDILNQQLIIPISKTVESVEYLKYSEFQVLGFGYDGVG